jgi:5-oxoprolinase (ATP-hydrolysing)
MRDVLLHPLAGILSAWGIGISGASWDGAARRAARALPRCGPPLPTRVRGRFASSSARGARHCARRASPSGDPRRAAARPAPRRHRDRARRSRTRETETCGRVRARHEKRFGYTRRVTRRDHRARVRVFERRRAAPSLAAAPPRAAGAQPRAHRARLVPGARPRATPVYWREDLAPGTRFAGPALILEATGTSCSIRASRCASTTSGVLRLRDERARGAKWRSTPRDPVRLEVFGNRCMSIAEQMGAVLRNTSVSTNIKERLDYSCAVFDAAEGSSPTRRTSRASRRDGETVRVVREPLPDLAAATPSSPTIRSRRLAPARRHRGDARVRGRAAPSFFVASRGHPRRHRRHEPGLDARDSRTLEEEGVLIEPLRAVRAGTSTRRGCARCSRRALPRAPARRQRRGARRDDRREPRRRAPARALGAEQGAAAIARDDARAPGVAPRRKVRREIARPARRRAPLRRSHGRRHAGRVRSRRGERMAIDFRRHRRAVAGNLNAPRAVCRPR